MTVKLQLQNFLINGSFEYWQRGTSFPAAASGTYTSDRWSYGKVGTAVHTLSRSTDVPANAFGSYSLYTNVTTAQASMGSGDNFIITQVIEGNFLRSFKGKKMVLTFWVKAFKTGTYCLNMRNVTTFPTRRSLVKEYTVSQSDVWEKKTIRFQQDSDSNWNLDNSGGVVVSFILAVGSSLTTSSQDWQSGIFLATPNQVNACDSTSNTFQLADVCLVEDNEGQTREPEFQLAGRNLFEELQLCQRYYEKYESQLSFVAARVDFAPVFTDFKVKKRALPFVSVFNPSSGINNTIFQNDGSGAPIERPISSIFSDAARINSIVGSLFVGAHYTYGWTADAEL